MYWNLVIKKTPEKTFILRLKYWHNLRTETILEALSASI